MHTLHRIRGTQHACRRYHPRNAVLPKAHAAAWSVPYTALLLIGVMVYLGWLSRLECAAAHSQTHRGAFSAAAGRSVQPFGGVPDTIAPPADQPGFPAARFTIFLHVWDSEDMPFLSVPDLPYEAALDSTNSAGLGVYEALLGILSPLAWVNYRQSNALQWRVDQFVMLPDSAAVAAPQPTDFSYPSLLPRLLTVAQVHGTLILPARDRHALYYAVYTGVRAEDTPDSLMIGAHVRYTFGLSEGTFGIDYLYSQRPNGNMWLGLSRLLEQDKRIVATQLLQGLRNGEDTSLAVHAKPVFHINHQWAMFYRFDQLFLGHGLAKLTEHTVGVKFLLRPHVALQAEFMMGSCDNPSIEAQGFRLAGTIRF